VISLRLSDKTLYDLEDNLLMFFTGYTRKANIILKENDDNVKNNEEQIINSFNYIKQIGYESKDALEKGDTKLFGVLMNSHWNAKKAISNKISNDNIDKWYDVAMQNGALGGKICGAGGGGFFVFYAEDRNTLRETMKNEGLEELRFRFDFEGTKIIHNE
jgi:D-glycero-alpha-D-manno-heptose-7-phosphate kinase